MTSSEAINDLAAAIAKAQASMKPAVKDARNPHFNSTYADLAAVIEAAKTYAAHGIAIVQDVTTSETGVSVTTRMIHASGQWLEFGPLTVPMGKRDAHGVGSATTYAKRYALQGAALIPSDDDDGNAATQAPAQAIATPRGFDEWQIALETIAKNEGAEALKEAWKTSRAEFRKFMTEHRRDEWEAIKARAQQSAEVPA